MQPRPHPIFSFLVEAVRARMGSLRLRIVGLLLLALLPAFAAMVFSAAQSRTRAIQETQDYALRLTELAAANQRRLIDGARDILITLAQLPAIQSQDRPACLFFLSNVLMQHPLYANFGAADIDGNVFCMTLPQRLPVNIYDEEYFQQSLASRDFAISDYQISPTNSQTMITLAYPVLNALGQPQGIVFANLDLRWLEQFMTAPLPEGSTLRVIDPNGLTLASYPDGEIEIGQIMPEEDITRLVLQTQIGLTQGDDIHGVSRLFAFTPLNPEADPDVYVIISIPTAVAFSESNENLARNLSALLAGAGVALAIAWTGTRFFFLRQVNALVDVTQRLRAGDLSARTETSGGQGELDQLARAFNQMAAALQHREQEQQLAQSQIRRQTRRAEALARIAGRLNARLELDSVLQAVCAETSRALNVPAVGVVVYGQGREDLVYIGGRDYSQTWKAGAYPLSRSGLEAAAVQLDPLTLQVDLHHRPDLIPEGLAQALNGRPDVRWLVCANLVHEGRLIGRLDLFAADSGPIHADELMLLKGIADEAALAITNARLYTALRQEERIRADLLHKLIGAQEDERMRLSRELHDETSQSLTALMVGLDTIRIAAHNDISRVDSHLDNLKGIAEEMLHNIHRLIADLRPSLLDDLGLVAAIQWYGEQRLQPYGLTFILNNPSRIERLPRPVETSLFRIVQEGLTNILRHARASAVMVRLAQEQDQVLLEICDDGVGFDPDRLETDQARGGLGLRGMQERAAILGGALEIESAPGEGTTVRIRFPVYRMEES